MRTPIPITELKVITGGHPGGGLVPAAVDVSAEMSVGPSPLGAQSGRWFGRVIVVVRSTAEQEKAATVVARSSRMADLVIPVPPGADVVLGPYESGTFASPDGREVWLDFEAGFVGRVYALEVPRQ